MKHLRAIISATTKKEARDIATVLVKKKLVAGTMITAGETIYHWKGKLSERKYWNISAFTAKKQVKQIVRLVKSVNADEVPIISFYAIVEGNKDFLKWISKNTK
jgi:periplasmic divalent cation tolerance protein